MTQEEKQLLLKDLCARLPNKCRVFYEYIDDIDSKTYGYSLPLNTWCIDELEANKAIVKPYLRPMSSMTEKEKEELLDRLPRYWSIEIDKLGDLYFDICDASYPDIELLTDIIDWLNAHHFDYRGLIEKGLAIKDEEDKYGYKL